MLILAAAAVTAVVAISTARHNRSWLSVLSACAAFGVLGPIVALVVLPRSPDEFVITSTILVALVPVSAVIYSFTRAPAT